MQKEPIPTYDIYKKLKSDLQFECWTLDETSNPYDASRPHRHDYYGIFLFHKTGGTHELDFQVYPVKKNMLHFISPDQVHLLKRKPMVGGFALSFTKEFCSVNAVNEIEIDNFPFFNNPYSTPIVELKTRKQQKAILDLVGKIKSEFHSEDEDKADILRSYLRILLVQLRRIYQPAGKEPADISARQKLVRNFKQLIESNFSKMKSVSEYADLLHITAGHLNDTVHEATGKTAGDMISERITLETKRMLYHSGQSVKEIAHYLNFDDPSHFAKFFKNQTGLSPEQFRQQFREKYL